MLHSVSPDSTLFKRSSYFFWSGKHTPRGCNIELIFHHRRSAPLSFSGKAVDGEPPTHYVLGMAGKFTDFIGIQLDDCKMVYRVHATQRMFERGISDLDVWAVLRDGHVVEEYADDYPLPSFLVCGADQDGRMLHVVAALDASAKIMYIITTYIPDAQKWDNNFTRRRKP